MERQQFLYGPPVVSESSSHGRGTGRQGSGPRARQARMKGAEGVYEADQVHPVVKRSGAPGQGPAPAGEHGPALAEGGIEPFNGSGVDDAIAALRAAAKRLDLGCRASKNAMLNTDHAPLDTMLDDLHNI